MSEYLYVSLTWLVTYCFVFFICLLDPFALQMKADTTESVCRREPECLPQKPESLPQKPQKKYGINWRDDEFPTLTAGKYSWTIGHHMQQGCSTV